MTPLPKLKRTYLAYALLNTPQDSGSPGDAIQETQATLRVGCAVEMYSDKEAWLDAMLVVDIQDLEHPLVHVVVRAVVSFESEDDEEVEPEELEKAARSIAVNPACQKAIEEMNNLLRATGIETPQLTAAEIIKVLEE